ncbi:TPA: hypothetical protein H1009_02140 [archaeon]|nr:hypothetical protein [Candidatus Naiadarchaeales archaeon SRR2090153.bin461]
MAKDVVSKLKEEALALLNKGEQIAAIFNRVSNGLFMYKHKPVGKFKIAYACKECGNTEFFESDLAVPYTVNCRKCNHLVFKQEKAPKPRGRKKKEPK